METLVAIKTRRSIRKYQDKEIRIDLLKELLDAAMMAPSAGNQQSWHFIIIQDRNILDDLAEEHPYGKMLNTAPAAIIVCADPSLEIYQGSWPVDCAAATQNILLAAHDFGLGSVWVGLFPHEERMNMVRRVCEIPDSIKPVTMIALGWPAEKRNSFSRFRIDRVHFNKWSNMTI